MSARTTVDAAIAETLVFLSHFSDLDDPRQNMKVRYPLPEVLLLCLVAVLAGAETITDIALFGKQKIAFLRRLLSFRYGTPSHDHLGDILATLDPAQFQSCFARWVMTLTGAPQEVVAIDGKSVRRSVNKAKKEGAVHIVSAFSARRPLVLGQVKVSEKSNEITAIPRLLDLLSIEGAIVTIDAMGCQRDIATKILDKKADYIFSLKGNQSSLHEDIKLFAAEQKARQFQDTRITQHPTVDADHGRIETRHYTVFHDVSWLQQRHNWPGLQAFVMVESIREIPTTIGQPNKIETETRFYLTSLTGNAAIIGPAIRDHWSVENGLHWVMDMVFRDDECRVRTDNAPTNFTVIKHIAFNLLKSLPAKLSTRSKRKAAAWNDEFLYSIIARR